MLLDLKEKNAIVCGSTQGIGLAIARQFALLGANVLLIARDEEKLKKITASLENKAGQKHAYLCVDFQYPDLLQEAINDYVSNNPEISILVNNTGGPPAGKAIDASLDDFMGAFKQHLICNQILVQAVVPGMINKKYGRIINIISTSVKTPIPGLGVSNTIRGAVASWAKTLSFELASFGITVNNVLPGFINTGRLDGLIKNRAKKAEKSEEFVRSEMISEIPAGYIGSPDDLANAVAFLASPAAAYVNGINLPVDGGKTGAL